MNYKANSTHPHMMLVSAHLACISAFYNGNSESYVREYQQKITKLESLGEPTWVNYKVKEYKDIIDFVIDHIPPKIKWHQLTCNN